MQLQSLRGLGRQRADRCRSAVRPGQALHVLRKHYDARRPRVVCAAAAQQQAVRPEAEVPGMSPYLDSLRWNSDGLVAVIAQVCIGSVCTICAAASRHGFDRCACCCDVRTHDARMHCRRLAAGAQPRTRSACAAAAGALCCTSKVSALQCGGAPRPRHGPLPPAARRHRRGADAGVRRPRRNLRNAADRVRHGACLGRACCHTPRRSAKV